jgi:hypothetical protein
VQLHVLSSLLLLLLPVLLVCGLQELDCDRRGQGRGVP